MTPPEISYEVSKNAAGRQTGELKLVVQDQQSGVDYAKTQAVNANDSEPGAPYIQRELTEKEKQSPHRHTRFYELVYPEVLDTDTQNDGGFGITAANQNNSDGVKRFGSGTSSNKAGIPFQIALGVGNRFTNLLGDSECHSNGNNFKLAGVFDLDHEGPDLTFTIFPKQAIMIDPFRDVRGVTAYINGRQTPSLIQSVPIWNASQILDRTGQSTSFGRRAQQLYAQSQTAKTKRTAQALINEGFDLLKRHDAQSLSFAEVGSNAKEISENLKFYKQNAPTLHEMIRVGLKGKTAPASMLSPYYNNNRAKGVVYDFSVDLDQMGINNIYDNLSVGQSTTITVNVKGELIRLTLTKQQKTGRTANWSVRCGA